MPFDPKRTLLCSNNTALSPMASLGLAAAVGIVYFLAAKLSLALISRPDGVAVFWPAAGVSSGVLIGLGPAALLPVVVGTALATILANLLGDRDIWSSLVFALCNSGEAVAVALLVQHFFGAPFRLDSVARVFGLMAAALVATALSGVIATAGYILFYASPAPALTIFRRWVASDAIGIITVAPLMLGLFSALRGRALPREIVEGSLALLCVAALAGLMFRLPSQAWAVEVVVALFFPISLWVAARCQPCFAAAAVAFVALAVVWSTTFGIGVFGNTDLAAGERVLTAQASILATALGALVLAALFAERRRHETIVTKNEARLQDALQIGGVMAFDWNVAHGTTERSDNAAQILGLPPNRPFFSAAFLQRIDPDDRARYRACLHALGPEEPSYVVSFRWSRPDGEQIWLEEIGRAAFDAAGRIVEVTGLTRDITERKRAEAELAASRKATELADRAKSGFLAAASHDLRQPLQSLTLLGNALKAHVHNAAGHLLVARIERSLQLMKNVLDSLLDINRLETGVLAPSKGRVAVGDLFGALQADFLEFAQQKGLEWRLVQSRLAVHSDPRLLEIMLRNLLTNALRYTECGRILLGCRRAGDMVRIEVWDNGIGIAREHLPRVFDEYYQVDDRTHLGSFGLGLAIVQRLGHLLGHRVDVRSTPGKGSCFSIEVPLARGPASAGAESAQPAKADAVALRGTVLVIEDDSFVRGGIEMLLAAEGVNAAAAANGHEALELVTAKRVRPHVILSDFNLPGRMNGVETIRAVREALGRHIPAVVVTGDVRSEVLDAIAEHDVVIATKPIDADQLMRLLRQEPADAPAEAAE
jgi:signal transduction histidine kinase/CheY-like chemotaxis protein